MRELLDAHAELENAELLAAFPENEVSLPGSGFGSHTDLWALLRTPTELISLAVEAKAGEPFGETVGVWLAAGKGVNSEANRRSRMEALYKTLGIACNVGALGPLRYQLFHRTASALLEATRCHAQHAMVLVQDFSGKGGNRDFQDFVAFSQVLGAKVSQNCLVEARPVHGKRLWFGWTKS